MSALHAVSDRQLAGGDASRSQRVSKRVFLFTPAAAVDRHTKGAQAGKQTKISVLYTSELLQQ